MDRGVEAQTEEKDGRTDGQMARRREGRIEKKDGRREGRIEGYKYRQKDGGKTNGWKERQIEGLME